MANARRNGSGLKQANRLPALLQKRTTSVDRFAPQRKGARADGPPEQIRPRGGFAGLDVENDFTCARLVRQELRAVDRAAAVCEVACVVFTPVNVTGGDTKRDWKTAGRHGL